MKDLNIEDMVNADPQKDLTLSLREGDFRFIGIYGFSYWCPESNGLEKRYGSNPIRGTSDFHFDEQTEKLNYKATKYAIAYNKALVLILTDKKD